MLAMRGEFAPMMSASTSLRLTIGETAAVTALQAVIRSSVRSTLSRRVTTLTATCGLAWVSMITGCSLRPPAPPWALMSETAHSRACTWSWPKGAALPVSGRATPKRNDSLPWANAGAAGGPRRIEAPRPSARPVPRTRRRVTGDSFMARPLRERSWTRSGLTLTRLRRHWAVASTRGPGRGGIRGRTQGPDGPAVEEGEDALDRLAVEEPVLLGGDVADVRGGDHGLDPPERVVERQRLDVEDIEPGARESSALKGLDQGPLVHDRSPRGVDEIGRRLHERELACADQAASAWPQHDVDRHHVRPPQQLLLGDQGRARGGGALGGQVLAPSEHLHRERAADRGHRGTGMSEPDHTERLVLEPDAEARPPAAGAHAPGPGHDPGTESEDEAPGQLRGGVVERLGPTDDDSALARRRVVDRPVHRPGGDEEPQPRQPLDQAPAERGALALGDDDVVGGEAPGHRGLVGEMVREDVGRRPALEHAPVRA